MSARVRVYAIVTISRAIQSMVVMRIHLAFSRPGKIDVLVY